jgi:hypothetical protein
VHGDSWECARWLLVHCQRRIRDLQVLWLGARSVSDARSYVGADSCAQAPFSDNQTDTGSVAGAHSKASPGTHAGTYSERHSAEHLLQPRGEPGEPVREPVRLLRRVRLLPRHRPVLELHDEPLRVGKPLQRRRELR